MAVEQQEPQKQGFGLVVCQSPDLKECILQALAPLPNMPEIVSRDALEKALALTQGKKPAFVILNWTDSSLEQNSLFLQLFRKKEGYKFIPIILLAESLNRSLLACATEYQVSKILNISRLNATLESALEEVVNELTQPSSAISFQLQIAAAADKNHFGEIQQLAQDYFNLFPNDPRAQLEYANLCLQKGDHSKAMQLANKVLDKNKNNLRAVNILARAMMFEGKFGEAILVLEEAESLSPRNLDRLIQLGDVYQKIGENTTARGHYTTALKIDPNNRSAKVGLGQLELSEGEVNVALNLFRDAATEEEVGGFFNNAAIFAVRKGEFEKAMFLYDSAGKALKQEPLKAKVLFNRGLAYKKWNRVDQAISCFQETLQLQPQHEKALRQLLALNANVPGRSNEKETTSNGTSTENAPWQDLNPELHNDPLMAQAVPVENLLAANSMSASKAHSGSPALASASAGGTSTSASGQASSQSTKDEAIQILQSLQREKAGFAALGKKERAAFPFSNPDETSNDPNSFDDVTPETTLSDSSPTSPRSSPFTIKPIGKPPLKPNDKAVSPFQAKLKREGNLGTDLVDKSFFPDDGFDDMAFAEDEDDLSA